LGKKLIAQIPYVLLAENDEVIETLLLDGLREFLRVNALSDIVECREALRGLV
jgi:hypothetical protein